MNWKIEVVLFASGVVPSIPAQRKNDIRHKGLVENNSCKASPRPSQINVAVPRYNAAFENEAVFLVGILSSLRCDVSWPSIQSWCNHWDHAVVINGLPRTKDEINSSLDGAFFEVMPSFNIPQRILQPEESHFVEGRFVAFDLGGCCGSHGIHRSNGRVVVGVLWNI